MMIWYSGLLFGSPCRHTMHDTIIKILSITECAVFFFLSFFLALVLISILVVFITVTFVV